MKMIVFILLLGLSSATFAQEHAEYVLQVAAPSVFLRAAPTTESDQTTSVFENDSLIAVGRNMDGQWLEVRRPGRRESSGWIARNLVLLTFDVGQIPMTDGTTGLIGPEPVVDTGFAVTTVSETPLHRSPDRSAPTLETIPALITLPVVARTPDIQWLEVNYRGTLGWIPQFLTSTRADLSAIPLSPEYAGAPRYAAFATISPEQQLAQVDRLLNFIAPLNQTAADVAFYWASMSRGETMECKPPAGNYPHYAITAQDIVELPELRQQGRLLDQAVDDLNASIDAMRTCGIYLPQAMRRAYAKALSAQNVFRQVVRRMEDTRIRITDDHRRIPTTDGS